jgi:ssDNA-binding Zn-finger/Zn-ribbon topoisomerase 1
MMAHHASIALLLSTLAAQPDPEKKTGGVRCGACGKEYVIAYGRHSKRWLVKHGLNWNCPRAGDFLRPHAVTFEQGVQHAREHAEL